MKDLEKLRKSLSIFLVVLMALTILTFAFQQSVKANDHPGPYYKVEPEIVTMGPDPAVNKTFTVSVWLRNVTSDNVPAGVFGVEIKLQWDTNLLEFVNRTLYIGEAGGVLNSPYFTAKDELTTTTAANDTYWIASSSLSGADPWFGNGKVADFTFRVIYQPMWYEKQKDSCPLKLVFTDLVDATAAMVTHDREDGLYEILAIGTSTVIKVEPSEISYGPQYAKNQTFTIDINLCNIDQSVIPNGTYGVEVKLSWNATLLEYVSHEVMLGKPGGVLNEPLFVAFDNVTIEGGKGTYWLVATSLKPAEYWYGNGTIVKITFRIIYQGWEPEPVSSTVLDLEFTDVVMPRQPYAISIPHTTEDGYYEIKPLQHITLYNVTYNDMEFAVTIESDGAVIAPANLGFDADLKQITFNVTYADGYCNVTIPKDFMWCDNLGEWNVLVDGEQPLNLQLSENTTHTFIWFNFTEGDHTIVIQSTYAIPEIPSNLVMLMILIISTAILIVIRKRRK